MAIDPTGFAVDTISVQSSTYNDAGEHSLATAVTFPGRIVNRLTVTYAPNGEAVSSPAYAIVFCNAATDITPASIITTSEGVQQTASVEHVRDETGAFHHTKVMFS
jgi:hypothetical protein